MPEINVAASPVALVSAPATGGDANAATAADGQAGGPFSAILMRQMNEPAAISVAAVKPGLLTAANVVAAAESKDAGMAALLPVLIGSAELAAEVATGKASRGTPRTAEDPLDPAATQAELASALPPGLPVVTNTLAISVSRPDESGQATGRPGRIAVGLQTTASGAAPVVVTDNPPAAAPPAAGSGSQADAGMVQGSEGPSALLPAANPPARVAAWPTAAAVLPSDRDLHAEPTPADHTMVPMHASAAAVHAGTDSDLRIVTPVGSRGWDSAIGDSVIFMSSNQQSRAEFVLTPPQLGRIEISLTMNGDQANAFFVSANPMVRDALESALPRLREILADAGVTLNQAQVGSESPSAGNRENGDNSRRGPVAGLAGERSACGVTVTVAAPWVTTGRGMVDVFA